MLRVSVRCTSASAMCACAMRLSSIKASNMPPLSSKRHTESSSLLGPSSSRAWGKMGEVGEIGVREGQNRGIGVGVEEGQNRGIGVGEGR